MNKKIAERHRTENRPFIEERDAKIKTETRSIFPLLTSKWRNIHRKEESKISEMKHPVQHLASNLQYAVAPAL